MLDISFGHLCLNIVHFVYGYPIYVVAGICCLFFILMEVFHNSQDDTQDVANQNNAARSKLKSKIIIINHTETFLRPEYVLQTTYENFYPDTSENNKMTESV